MKKESRMMMGANNGGCLGGLVEGGQEREEGEGEGWRLESGGVS